MTKDFKCPDCKGKGYIDGEECEMCFGTGYGGESEEKFLGRYDYDS